MKLNVFVVVLCTKVNFMILFRPQQTSFSNDETLTASESEDCDIEQPDIHPDASG